MTAERLATFYVVLLAILSIWSGLLLDVLWSLDGHTQTPLRFAPIVGIGALLVRGAIKAITESGDREFKLKLSIILSVLLTLGIAASIFSFFFLPQAMLTCELFVVALSYPHFHAIDTFNQQYFQSRAASIVSDALLLVGVPFTAFCFTLSWSATILPSVMLVYAYSVENIAMEPVLRNPNYNPRVTSIMLCCAVILSVLCASISFFHSSLTTTTKTFITGTFALTAVVMTYIIVDLECFVAMRANRSQYPVLALANVAAALGLAAVIGAARAAAVDPQIWEVGGELLMLPGTAPSLVFMIARWREEVDLHLGQPNPITARVTLKIAALTIVMLLLPISAVGSYIYREALPSTTSPMPLVACVLMLITLFLLDSLRNNIPREYYVPLAVVFATVSVAIGYAIAHMYFSVHTASIMEALITAFIMSACLAFYFARTDIQKDETEKRHLTAQATARLQYQHMLQNYFRGPIPPAA